MHPFYIMNIVGIANHILNLFIFFQSGDFPFFCMSVSLLIIYTSAVYRTTELDNLSHRNRVYLIKNQLPTIILKILLNWYKSILMVEITVVLFMVYILEEADKILPSHLLLQYNKEEQECTICLLNMKIDETVVVTNCNHVYHPKCITTWNTLNQTCPLCRTCLHSSYDSGRN